MIGVTYLIKWKEKCIKMDKIIRESIFEHTGKRCVSSVVISSGVDLRQHYKIILEDGTKYLCKLLKMSREKLSVYKNIVDMNINCFQRTCHLWLIENDTYIVLVEWIDGKLIKECGTEDSYLLGKLVGEAAKTIRKVHNKKMTQQEITISLNDVEKMFEKNKDLLESDYYEVIKKYVVENYHYLNGRKQTVIHGDLHLHNILNTANGISFIDIDDCRFGDPYMDLIYASNLIKSKSECTLYYTFLMGYFENEIPQEFWIIVNIYSIYKALHIMRCEKEYTSNHKPIYSLDGFLKQHETMTSHVPIWFKEEKKRWENDKRKSY